MSDQAKCQQPDIEFSSDQFVFRDPTIRDFYDIVAGAVLATQGTGRRVKFKVRSWREGQLLRIRVNGLVKARLKLSPWHWCATSFTRADPDAVYAWIGTIVGAAAFMSYYRNFPASRVMEMMNEPAISVVKLPTQRRTQRFEIEHD